MDNISRIVSISSVQDLLHQSNELAKLKRQKTPEEFATCVADLRKLVPFLKDLLFSVELSL